MDRVTVHLHATAEGLHEVTLANHEISVSVLPALGSKVSSLRHLASGREWMWKPQGFRGYFANGPDDSFQDGTLVGWDECLPTIALVAGRDAICRITARYGPPRANSTKTNWKTGSLPPRSTCPGRRSISPAASVWKGAR